MKEKFFGFDVKNMSHSLYPPDIKPSDYYCQILPADKNLKTLILSTNCITDFLILGLFCKWGFLNYQTGLRSLKKIFNSEINPQTKFSDSYLFFWHKIICGKKSLILSKNSIGNFLNFIDRWWRNIIHTTGNYFRRGEKSES